MTAIMKPYRFLSVEDYLIRHHLEKLYWSEDDPSMSDQWLELIIKTVRDHLEGFISFEKVLNTWRNLARDYSDAIDQDSRYL